MKLTETEKAKTARGKCVVPYCRCDREQNGTKQYYKCAKHRGQAKHLKHPWIRRFQHVKFSAKRRGIPFDLTYEQFKAFCIFHELLENHLTVDRTNPELGYTISNIRPLTFEENSRLGAIYGNAKRRALAEKIAQETHVGDLADTEDPF